MLLSFFYQRQILQLQPSSLKKSPSLWGKGKIFYNWNAAMRPHSYPVASLVRRCTHDRPHGKAVPSPRVSSPLPGCLRERHHPQLVSIQQWKKKKIETDWKQVKRSSISYQQLCNTLLFWRILLYAVIWLIFAFQSFVSLPLLFRNFQVIDNQRKLTQLSHRLEPRKTAWQSERLQKHQQATDVHISSTQRMANEFVSRYFAIYTFGKGREFLIMGQVSDQ